MTRKVSEYTKEECQKILDSIILNKRHLNKTKTLSFLLKLKKMNENSLSEVLEISEGYYFYVKNYLSLTEREKVLFATGKIKEFKNSELHCCSLVFDTDSIGSILQHTLCLEHYLLKENINIMFHKDIENIVEYFKATQNINKSELIAIYELIKENKKFYRLVMKEKSH